MFVRKKRNRSGSVSVAVVDKSKGRFREIRQFGVAHNAAEVEALVSQANHWIRQYGGQQLIDFQAGHVSRQSDIDMFVSHIDASLSSRKVNNHIPEICMKSSELPCYFSGGSCF